MIPIDKYGNTIKSDEPTRIAKPKTIYKPNEESTARAIARNIYKPVREVGSVYGGIIPSLWNTLAPFGEKLSKYITPSGHEQTKLARFPEEMTISGLRKGITKRIGESAFGEGSLKKQPGIAEGFTTRASKILPYALLSGGGLVKTLLSATGGEAVRIGGGGKLSQAAGEVAGGFLPEAIYKMAGPGIRVAAKKVHKEIFGKTTKRAAQVGEIPTKVFKNKINESFDRLSEVVTDSDLKKITKNFATIEKGLGGDTMSAQRLINYTTKLGGLSQEINKGKGRFLIGELRGVAKDQLDKLISSYPESRNLTKAIFANETLQEAAKNASKVSAEAKGMYDYVTTAAKIAAIPLSIKFGGLKGGLMAAATLAGSSLKEVVPNLKLLQASPTLRKVTRNAITDLAGGNIISASRGIEKITDFINKKEKKKTYTAMIPIDKYGNKI